MPTWSVLLLAMTQTPTEWTVSPAKLPVPILRYELLPRGSDLKPGNAAMGYLQALQQRLALPSDEKELKAFKEKETKFLNDPLESISLRELTEHLKPYQAIFTTFDRAARMKDCDWQRDGQLTGEGLLTVLPELQQHREMARVQQLRIRQALLDRQYDQAVHHWQTAIAHGKHVAEGPMLVQALVGLAILQSHFNLLDDLLRSPGAPNLYAGLTMLPRPLVNIRKSLDGEERFFHAVIPGLTTLETAAVPAEQSVAAIERLVNVVGAAGETQVWRTLTSKVGVIGYTALYRDEARAELIANGRNETSLAGMSPAQLCLLRVLGQCRQIFDEQTYLFALPPADAAKRRAALKQKIATLSASNDPLLALTVRLIPTTEKVQESLSRVERRIDWLRTIEAIRSSENFPKTLTDVPHTPVPHDPMTGQPFRYVLKDGKAELSADAPPGEPSTPLNAWMVTVTFRKTPR